MPTQISRLFHRYVSFRRVVGLYRRRLSRRVYAQCQGIVRHGPLTGMRWLDNPRWGRSEQGVMILGLYEQEVLKNLFEAPDQYRVFVDVGAADGYYAVGLLFAGRVDRSLAFETLPACREAIGRLAAANGVADRIRILGTASGDFAGTLRAEGIKSSETMFLIDIEGAEFRILQKDFFGFLKESVIVIETHAHIYPDPEGEMQQLIAKASATHRATTWYPGARNPWALDELEAYAEVDRWILCSEGRMELQQWLRFDPL